MPSFNIVKEVTPNKSFRVASVIGKFDLQSNHVKESFTGNIDLENTEWQIGIIVGSSGSGKTSIAKHLFPDHLVTHFEYSSESILDDFPDNLSITEITKTFNQVGFSSPPSWLKPYHILSNGEKMRVDLARAILGENDLIVFDEFTSVVDRNVARIGSYAVSKAIKKSKKKFIAVSCHYDIIEWLEPDWIYDTDKNEFKYVRGLLRHPGIHIRIYEAKGYWERFRKYHYLNTEINKSAKQFVGMINDELVCFQAVLSFPHGKIKNGYRSHRLVVLPDYQGIGIGIKFQEKIAELFVRDNKRFFATTSNPALINHRSKSKNWIFKGKNRKVGHDSKIPSLRKSRSSKRITSSWEYIIN